MLNKCTNVYKGDDVCYLVLLGGQAKSQFHEQSRMLHLNTAKWKILVAIKGYFTNDRNMNVIL